MLCIRSVQHFKQTALAKSLRLFVHHLLQRVHPVPLHTRLPTIYDVRIRSM